MGGRLGVWSRGTERETEGKTSKSWGILLHL
uniref:Uncharacterized protein n=1 Tax=Anguilla anguilla TaxID=7936 RepID=A0A0E9U7N9_ANGAN